jgi:hypothetical protein
MSPFLVAGACALGKCVAPNISRDLIASFSSKNPPSTSFSSVLDGALRPQKIGQSDSVSGSVGEQALWQADEMKSAFSSLRGVGSAVVSVDAEGNIGFLIGGECLRVPLSASTRLLAKDLFSQSLSGGLVREGLARFAVSL